MKNFDLNACGVQEMNAAEVAEVNGGTAPWNECRRPDEYAGYGGGSTGGGGGGSMSFGETAWWSWLLFHGING
ncbi:hypothetical protein [Williamwhitmania taraxaci]|uniref:Uncharacterized protein n=1 Tax=Williamwhitmania taraxaci TaxID=1640674 RepID=A0A1G6SGK5_9BACT|nr:hypothetical protein [Williamwhitmania taraxaci]SDD15998.1 hypothetical protein SAMN05216323_10947 [Williamwhitmania taraxaci]